MLVAGIFALLVVLMLMGLPIVFAMGVATLTYLAAAGISFSILPQRMVNSVSSFVIIAIPLFYLAGDLMNACRLTDRIVHLARAFVGHFHGGLAQVNIVSGVIFSGISGSATADTAAIGAALIPAMKKEGYPAAFSAAVTVSSGMLGPIIPPSIALVIYGALANQSIGKLLLAGIVPGLLIGLCLMLWVRYEARVRRFPRHSRAALRDMACAIWQGAAALLFPVIILAGIMLGVFTPTEAAAVAVLYALAIGFLLYRSLTRREAWGAFMRVCWGSARVLIIIAVASAFSWVVARERVPDAIVAAMLDLTQSPTVVLFLMIGLLLLVGLFMIESAALIVLTPILVPVVEHFGIDPIHFGVLMVYVLVLGGGHPPVGVLLFVAQDIAHVPYGELVRAMLPFYIPLLAASVIIALFPGLTLWIPNLVMG
jgi:C4-dicarboxylate transporter DctM subunit